MAFEQRIEADQVGDNILISFVTRPLLGTLMWIIGDNDDDNNHEQKKQDEALQRGLQDMMLDDDDHRENPCGQQQHHHQQQASLPRLVRSDVSVGVAESQPSLLPRRSSFTSLLNNSDNNNNHHYEEQLQDKKKMSWSENLVEYMDDEVRRKK